MSENLFDLSPKNSSDVLFAREKELDETVRLIKAKRWVALLRPRMVGKTSLIKVANNKLDRTGIYMNLWGIKSTYGVLTSLINTINSQKPRQKLYDSMRSINDGAVKNSSAKCKTPVKFCQLWLDIWRSSNSEFLSEPVQESAVHTAKQDFQNGRRGKSEYSSIDCS